jgi:hypothetical protein
VLKIEQLPLAAAKPLNDIARVGRGLQHACNANLATDARRVDDAYGSWANDGKLPAIDEWVIVYDQPVAVTAVDEAQAALTCRDYPYIKKNFTVTIMGPLDVGPAPPGARMFAFCESIGQASIQCTVIAGSGNLACSVRAAAQQKEEAIRLIQELLPLIRQACLVRQSEFVIHS